jgi:hypothetical protein
MLVHTNGTYHHHQPLHRHSSSIIQPTTTHH